MDEAAPRTDIRRARAGAYADWAARPHVVTLAFVVMLGIAVLVRLLLTRSFPAPWIMGDELHYSELARSFASDGVMRLREEPSALRSLYPVLISPAWLADSVGTAYALTKVINVLLMTSAAIPFFLWARRLVRPTLALVGTLLFLLLPAALYANLIMTESAFLPAFLLSVLLAALALEHPTPMRQVLAIVSIVLPVAIRAQGVVLVPILLTALVLKVLLDARASGRITFGSLRAELRSIRGHARGRRGRGHCVHRSEARSGPRAVQRPQRLFGRRRGALLAPRRRPLVGAAPRGARVRRRSDPRERSHRPCRNVVGGSAGDAAPRAGAPRPHGRDNVLDGAPRGRLRIALLAPDRRAEHVLRGAAAPARLRDLARQGAATAATIDGCRGRRAGGSAPFASVREPLQPLAARRHARAYSSDEDRGPPAGGDRGHESPARARRPGSGRCSSRSCRGGGESCSLRSGSPSFSCSLRSLC